MSEFAQVKQSGESEEREGEREREQHINGVRGGALDRNGNGNGNGMGQTWLLVKMVTRVFLVKQINRTNKLSIKSGGSQILQFHWCRNIHSHDDMFCHKCLVSQETLNPKIGLATML